MTKYYPVMIDMEGRPALVVGGGPIAARKAAGLLDYGARVTVVAREASPEVREMACQEHVALCERPFADSDLDDPVIVFAATNDRALHEHIKAECDRRRILCNIVDVTDLCGFIVPSIIRRGELMITISTDGMCPAYSKYQRKRMEQCCFPQGCEAMLHVVAAAREELKGPLGKGFDDEEKFEILRTLVEGELQDVLATRGEERARNYAREAVHKLVARRRGLESSQHVCSSQQGEL